MKPRCCQALCASNAQRCLLYLFQQINNEGILLYMEDNGVLHLTGIITDYTIWDDTINLYAEKFHKQFNVYPNILLASDFTYRKIDLYAQMHPERLIEDDGTETLETSDEPYEGISYFTTVDYELECCLDSWRGFHTLPLWGGYKV